MAKRTDELLSAVRHGTPELVRALALTGADIDECGNEALKEAINAERPEMLEMLISLGADITENRPAVAPEKRKAADYLTLNLLETYVLHKIATADSDTLSPK
ncbi:MAG: ankyrin repeat domain-containing protein, partial [Saccharofermentanales bacterium]